jgi:hypothetical protein
MNRPTPAEPQIQNSLKLAFIPLQGDSDLSRTMPFHQEGISPGTLAILFLSQALRALPKKGLD